jgi:hypothetical protein
LEGVAVWLRVIKPTNKETPRKRTPCSNKTNLVIYCKDWELPAEEVKMVERRANFIYTPSMKVILVGKWRAKNLRLRSWEQKVR